MATFCQNCGSPIKAGAKFCENCGAVLEQVLAPQAAQDFGGQLYGESAQRKGIPAPGFSTRVNDPEILAAVKKNRKAAAIFGFILVPLPLIGFFIYSLVSDALEPQQGLLYGGIISAVFLLFALYGAIKNRAANAYEGVVTDKKQRERADRNSQQGTVNYYTEYIIYVKTTDGKKKRIVEHSNGTVLAYHYLQVGDRFKYHPQFNFPYELYDKSKAPYIACVACGRQNSIDADRCAKCNTPLLK